MDKNSKILVVGHDEVMERALYHQLQKKGFSAVFSSSKEKLDTLSQKVVSDFFKKERPTHVFLGSIRSGGIEANQKFAAEFIYENLECQNNIVHAAFKNGVKKLLYFSGSCAYPKECPQPIKEEYLLTGPLEPTSQPYSLSKIAGAQMCQSYKKQYGFDTIVAVPATVFGPGSDTDITTSHVIGALIGKFCEAKSKNSKDVVVWGTGKPRREFIFADDFFDACLFLIEKYSGEGMINMGCGEDVSIKELAELIKDVSGYKGKIVFDTSKPDGTMNKLMDNTKIIKLGWKPKVDLKEGIKRTYEWYEQKKGNKR